MKTIICILGALVIYIIGTAIACGRKNIFAGLIAGVICNIANLAWIWLWFPDKVKWF